MADTTTTKLKERDVVLVGKDADNNTTIDYPLTRAEMVEGLDDAINNNILFPLPIDKGGTGATTADAACANLGALSTKGGTLSGDIYRSSDDSAAFFVGGTYPVQAPYLALYGKNHPYYPSYFCLAAKNAEKELDLVGNVDGKLEWGGRQLPLFVNNIYANTFGGITVIDTDRNDAAGYGWLRFYTSSAVRYVFQWNRFTLGGNLGAYTDCNIPIPINTFIVGGVNTQAFSLISIAAVSSAVMRIQKASDSNELNYVRTGTFWVLGVE